MKSTENILHDKVSKFIKENKILSDRQSGFRKLFFTSTAALDFPANILEELVNKKYVVRVLIGTVNHKILFKKIKCYSFYNQVFDWFEYYLSDWQQVTLINNVELDLFHEEMFMTVYLKDVF